MQCRLSDIAHTNCLDHYLEIRHFILAGCKLLQMSNYQEAECSADLVTLLTLTLLTLTAWIIFWKLDILFWLGVSYFKCPIIRKLNAVQT